MEVSGVAVRPKKAEGSGAEACVSEKMGALDLSGLGAATGALEQDAKRPDTTRPTAKASARRRERFSDNSLKLQLVPKDIQGIFRARDFAVIIQV
jgi:hypothetical protein